MIAQYSAHDDPADVARHVPSEGHHDMGPLSTHLMQSARDVGPDVGLGDGADVGLGDGAAVGLGDGAAVGLGEGAAVGLGEGFAVGDGPAAAQLPMS